MGDSIETTARSGRTALVAVLPPRRQLTTLENAAVGATAGTLEVLINQPFVGWKNALQEGRGMSFNPKFLYRGVVINAASIAPITAIQFAVNGILIKAFTQDGAREVTASDKLLAAATAGAASGLISGPAELVMIQQQRTGQSLFATAATVLREHGPRIFYKGFVPSAIRDGLFTCGYLGLSPVLRDQLLQHFPSTFENFTVGASFLASIAAGQIAAVLTQSSDVVKTRMQADLGTKAKPSAYPNMRAGIRRMWAEGGIYTLHAGLFPRGLRMVSAVFVLGLSNEFLSSAIVGR